MESDHLPEHHQRDFQQQAERRTQNAEQHLAEGRSFYVLRSMFYVSGCA
jgi:hypothetical protein